MASSVLFAPQYFSLSLSFVSLVPSLDVPSGRPPPDSGMRPRGEPCLCEACLSTSHRAQWACIARCKARRNLRVASGLLLYHQKEARVSPFDIDPDSVPCHGILNWLYNALVNANWRATTEQHAASSDVEFMLVNGTFLRGHINMHS